MINNNTSSSPKSSSNSSKSSQPGNNFIQVTRPLFRGEFKNYKVDKPKKMSTKTMKSTQKKPNESSTIKLKVPTPNTQKKESIMSQLTFHESYSKDLCPFGSAKVKNNPVRNHPYVQQFVLNTCQSTSTVMDSGSCSTFSSLSNGRSPKLTFKAPIENIQSSLQSGFKTCPQKENFIFHFKVDGGNIQQQSNNYQNSSCQQSFQTSFNSSSSCSSMSSSQNSNSNSSSFVAFPNQSASCVNAKPVMMETVVHEPELIILPPFRQVDKSENIKIPSMKYIESLIHSKGIQSQ